MRVRLALAAVICAIGASAPAESPIFEFHSGFWLNLHQFLLKEGAADKPAEGPAEWRRAVEYYQREMLPLGLLGGDARAVNNRLSAAESRNELPADGLDPQMAEVLRKAAPPPHCAGS